MSEGLSRVFYRIVQSDPPVLRDFMSYEALGIPPRRPLSRIGLDRWRGVSHYATLPAARATVRALPHLGDFIAVVHVPTDGSVRIEQTGRDPDHFTIWADSALLLALVRSVLPGA